MAAIGSQNLTKWRARCLIVFSRTACSFLLFLAGPGMTPYASPGQLHSPIEAQTVFAQSADVTAIELVMGASAAQDITSGRLHAYRFNIDAGQLFRAQITKGDLNVLVKIFDSGGQKLGEFISRRFEPLDVLFIAEASGPHRLELHSLESDTAPRRYTIFTEAPRMATGQDKGDLAAIKSLAAAEFLRTQWTKESLQDAIEKYSEAEAHWRSTGNELGAARALKRIGDIHFMLGAYRLALDFFNKALYFSQKRADRRMQAQALNDIGYAYIYLGENRKALANFSRSLDYLRSLPSSARDVESQRLEAQTHNNMGEVSYALGELKRSVALFDRALALWVEVGDRYGQALAHLNIGYSQSDAGDLASALDHFRASLLLWSAIDERKGEATTRTAIGTVHSFLGERQQAINFHNQSMNFFRAIGDRQGEAVALNSIGQSYEDLNDPQTALDKYRLSLEHSHDIGNRDSESVTEYYIGRVYETMEDYDQALTHYQRSISLSREMGKRRMEAYALVGVGTIYGVRGARRQALSQYQRLLKVYREIEDRRGQARALHDIGYLHQASGDAKQAISFFKEALTLYRAAGDRNGEVSTLFNLAHAMRDSGNIDEALTLVKEAMEIADSLRTKVSSQDLRASYFASVYKGYELYIDLLMQMSKQRPENNFAATALQASESARARSLLETLAKTNADIRQGVPPELLERERILRHLLSAKAEYQMRLLSNKRMESEAAEVEKEIRELTTEYQGVQALISDQNPRYAILTQPKPLSLEEIQAELRDDKTILLEYKLGDKRSYLWAVTASTMVSYELPGRAEVEGLAREVYQLLSARQPRTDESFAEYQARVAASDDLYWSRATSLSQMLLGNVAPQLREKRLLIVADGALQYIPFEALPLPNSPASSEPTEKSQSAPAEPPPLTLKHEVVSLPSVSALAALRREARASHPRKTIAVLADPVFEQSDVRIKPAPGVVRNFTTEPPASKEIQRALRGIGESGLARLPYTRQEATAIISIIPLDESMLATDFNASRTTAMSRQLGDYRILHFATHGIIDSQHPNLSGIVLSLFDEQGNQAEGFLHLYDIYNLNLSADLVVLSACRTALGKEVNGEGLVGLTRGFMYAGSKSVVASLWKVDDRATAELMTHFYRAMLKDGLRPSAALRAAKEAMWRQKRWHEPYFWAAFVLQGEYDESLTIADQPSKASSKGFAFVILLALFAGIIYVIWRKRINTGSL